MKTNISIKKFIELKKELRKRSHLQIVDTTEGRNGYPTNTHFAIVGFSTFEAVENFANRFGLSSVVLFKRDGWHFWHRLNNSPYKPLEGSRGGKVLSISEDTKNYLIGVNCF